MAKHGAGDVQESASSPFVLILEVEASYDHYRPCQVKKADRRPDENARTVHKSLLLHGENARRLRLKINMVEGCGNP